MTGDLILNTNPTQNLGAATKQYVDNNFVNKMEFVEQVSVYMADEKTNAYTFNSAFASLSNSYECMIVTVSGTVNTNGGTLSLFNKIDTYGVMGDDISSNSPAFYLFTKYGLMHSQYMCYAGLVAETGNNNNNLLATGKPGGQADTYTVSLLNPSSVGSAYVNIVIKFYGWNPI